MATEKKTTTKAATTETKKASTASKKATTATKKTSATKSAATKATATKSAATKTAATKTTATKAATTKTTATKSAAIKTAATKTAAKSTAGKAALKKTAAKRVTKKQLEKEALEGENDALKKAAEAAQEASKKAETIPGIDELAAMGVPAENAENTAAHLLEKQEAAKATESLESVELLDAAELSQHEAAANDSNEEAAAAAEASDADNAAGDSEAEATASEAGVDSTATTADTGSGAGNPAEKPKRKIIRDDPNRPEVTGILELAEGGFGFLRFDNFLTSDKDIYVSPMQIRRFHLKTGDEIKGISRLPNEGERFGALLFVETVNGDEPGVAIRRPDFSDLTPIFPKEKLAMEDGPLRLSMRLIDLIAPIGKGQRGIIVAPPKAGKTTLLKDIAHSIEEKYPETELIVLLVDERPEEVTDMKRSLHRSKVIYSTFDEMPQHHAKVAEMVLERAKRLAEHGKDVVILLDSLTRLARAYNLVIPPSGRTLSGGLDPGALHKPKQFFGAARNLEEGGSITILATALVDTGSRMDDVIFEEFKGTGNMELHLDRKLQEKRIFPAIDLNKSGTRREELLMSQNEIEALWRMRREMANRPTQEVTETIIDNLAHTRSNDAFIEILRKVFSD